ncbi:hypothetical protein F8388_004825 [Cannabis sativa]|uniref:FHA domain-containing protein n=1 Tax=Cannabis sativa TaxID=3483 RepID=A0A7J6HNL7_CANSA|nr:hypothetical protein F8388_004825 [Cannabis sativa]
MKGLRAAGQYFWLTLNLTVSTEAMVFGLIPVDPSPGENKYYITAKGSYKVGRKGCDIIITKDKGVSRVHAEIFVDEMTSANPPHTKTSNLSNKVRIKDCSKYGTFINKSLGSMEKVHEFPGKETVLTDGNLISFGTGNATYRFSFVPFIIWVYSLEPHQVTQSFQDKLSLIGADITYNFNQKCTHVLVDELTPLREELLDAIVAKKACVQISWVETVAEEKICTEIPSCSDHTPTLSVEDVSVKLADPGTRENCLDGYTFVLDSINSYKYRNQLKSLLELAGAKILSIEGFSSSSQGSKHEESSYVVCVIPGGSSYKIDCFNKLNAVSRVKEIDLIRAILTGILDRSILISPCVVVSSSCSTDETFVEDSEAEAEAEAEAVTSSVHVTAATHSEEVIEIVTPVPPPTTASAHSEEVINIVTPIPPTTTAPAAAVIDTVDNMDEQKDCALKINLSSFRGSSSTSSHVKNDRVSETEGENLDIIYSQNLIVRDMSASSTTRRTVNNEVVNFKRFRKRDTESGNSFNNLIPFSKYPYKESDNGNEEMTEFVKEEKRRKQMEAVADDLFNNERGRRRGVAGSIQGILTRR